MEAPQHRYLPGSSVFRTDGTNMTHVFSRPKYTGPAAGRLARNSALALITRIAPGIATLVMNIAIGRLGGTALLGLTQSVIASASLASLLNPAASVASRFLGAQESTGEEEVSPTASYLARRTLLAASLLGATVALATWLLTTPPLATIIMSGLMVLTIIGRSLLEGLHFGGGEGLRLAWWSSIIAAGSVLGTIVLLLCGVRSAWVLSPLVLSTLAFIALSLPGRSNKKTDRALVRDVRIYTFLAAAGTLASSGFSQAALLVAGMVNGLSYAGQYTAAVTLITPLLLLTTAVSSVIFPALAAAHASADTNKVSQLLTAATDTLLTPVVAAFIFLSIVGDDLVALVWGDGFALTSVILVILLPGVVATAVASPAVSSITSSSNRGMVISVVSSASGAIVGAVIWVLLTPSVPSLSVPIGVTVGVITIAGTPYVIAWRRSRMAWVGQTTMLVGALAVTPTISLMLIRSTSDWPLNLAVAVIAAAAWLVVRGKSTIRLVRALRKNLAR